MDCTRCQHENEAGAKFCEECGTKLVRTCAGCGHEVSLRAKFCPECGQRLGEATPTLRFASPQSYIPKHLAEKILTSRGALEGERKQVTVFFADIKGSTELIEGLDPEEAHKLLDPALHAMMEAVHRYEGTVNQVLGDGVMALFGAPLAHEDHAVRACYAALALQSVMKQYADQVRRSHGITMQIRVGLNSGEVVVRAIGNDLHMDYSAVGQTTHLAARMEQLAAPGSIMLTAATLRLVEGLIRVNALGSVPIKGLADPVEVFELVGASALRRRLQAAVARGLTPFVGREAEMEALSHALARAHAGHGQILAAVGEPGVGKSRMVYEFVHSHRTRGWLVLETASVSYGKATPYFPVVDLLKRYVHVEDGDELRTIRAKVTGQVLMLDEGFQDTIPVLLSLLDAIPEDSHFLQLDPSQRRQRTLDALKRVLLRESQVQPVLLVFEDLHWVDSETQALLDSLTESLPTAQVLLLVNYRPEYQHSWGSKTYYTQLRLDPLPPESADAFLQAVLGDDPSLESLKQLLIGRTEGNPFFLEESVRTLVETCVLVGESGAYSLAKALPTIQVPATVQAVLAARIDRLPTEEKRLLQTAAVIGPEVPFPLLHAIAELPENALHRGLWHLQATEFLYETRLFPERAYTFKHALTQDVAYQSLLTATRQQVHQQIARVLEMRFSEVAETQPELLAHHYTEAGLSKQAVDYWQRAGQRAIQRSAYVEAIAHLTKGLEVLKTLPAAPEHLQRELDMQITLGSTLMSVKGQAAPDVAQAFARARELCQEVGETPQLFHVLGGLCGFYVVRAELQTARELAEQLLRLAQQQQDPIRLIHAYQSLGGILHHLGEFVSALAHLEQGIALYGPQPRGCLATSGSDPGVVCLAFAAMPLWVLGYPDRAMQRSREALALAQELAHPFSLAYALNFVAYIHSFRREWQAVQERAQETIALSTEHEFALWMAQGTILQGWRLAAQGWEAEGMRQMHQGLAAYQATGAELPRPVFLAMLAEVYGKVRQTEEGLAVLAEAQTLVDNTGQRWWEAELYRLKGEFLGKKPESKGQELKLEAEACFLRALEISRRQSAKSWELRATMSLSRLWQGQGRGEEARQILVNIYGWFTEGFDTGDLKEAKSLLEELS